MCSPNQKVLCGTEECLTCFRRSFASHPKSSFWSDKNIIPPIQACMGSHQKYWFNCDCGHEFYSNISNISSKKWCSYCSNHKLCDDDNCELCLNKSFKSTSKYTYLLDKNIDPRKLFKGSPIKYDFICEKKHIFSASLSNISKNKWCPNCMFKTEEILNNFLKKNGYNFETQKTFSWCKNNITNQYLRFDFYISKYNLLIELDGPQHFRNISNWGDYKETQSRDIYKMKESIKNGFSLIRILQDDVFNNKNNWEQKLLNAICNYDKKQIIFIEENNVYDIYKKLNIN